jgi:hypothetical protein
MTYQKTRIGDSHHEVTPVTEPHPASGIDAIGPVSRGLRWVVLVNEVTKIGSFAVIAPWGMRQCVAATTLRGRETSVA